MNTRAQAWIIDLFAGILIFLIAFTILLKSNVNINDEQEETVKNIRLEGNLMSDMLLSEGYPEDWNSTDVIQIGITNANRINSTKLAQFTAINYNSTKTMFRTQFEYLFFFENSTGAVPINGETSFGYDIDPDSISTTLEPDHLHRIVRLTVYNSSIVRMVLYLWR